MSILSDLFKSVSELNLTKIQLEDYHTRLSALYAQIHEEMADLEKQESLFLLEVEMPTELAKKRKWNGTHEGLRLIELKHYSKGAEKLLSSLKSRLYGSY